MLALLTGRACAVARAKGLLRRCPLVFPHSARALCSCFVDDGPMTRLLPPDRWELFFLSKGAHATVLPNQTSVSQGSVHPHPIRSHVRV